MNVSRKIGIQNRNNMTIGMEIGEQRSCSQDNTETRLINYLAKSKVRNESSTMRTVL